MSTTQALAYAPTTKHEDGAWQWRVVALDTGNQPIAASEWRDYSVSGTPSAIEPPRIEGSGAVGSLLTGFAPTWNLPGVSTAYQWLRAGSVISGATGTSYEVTKEDVGKALSLRATGTKPGYSAGTSASNSITGATGPAPTAATPPRVDGSGQVGSVLQATEPVWAETSVATTYAWLRNGVVIPGQSTLAYKVVPTDVGSSLTLQATGKRSGYADAVVSGNLVRAVAGAALVATTPPTLTGTPTVGTTLGSTPGVWSQPSPALTYQWHRNGVPISGATRSTYTLVADDAARNVSVTLTATKPGFEPGTATPQDLKIAKLTSSTTASLSTLTVSKGKRATLTIAVVVAGLPGPTGTVLVKDGKRTLKKVALKASKAGRATLKLPRLKVGKHKIKVSYSGGPTIASSKAKAARLTVTR